MTLEADIRRWIEQERKSISGQHTKDEFDRGFLAALTVLETQLFIRGAQ